MPCYIPLI